MKPGYESDMQRQVARGITARPVGRGVLLEIPCTGGHTVEHTLDRMLPPDAMPRQLAQRGWRIERRKATCPDCVTKEKKTMSVQPAPVLRAVDTPATPPSEGAKMQRRLAYTAIEDVYDEKLRTYTKGASDAGIAAVVGCSENLVAGIREEFFGPAAMPEPPEVIALREDHAAVIEAIAAVRRDMASVRSSFETTLADLDKKATGIGHRLDNAAQANGWKR